MNLVTVILFIGIQGQSRHKVRIYPGWDTSPLYGQHSHTHSQRFSIGYLSDYFWTVKRKLRTQRKHSQSFRSNLGSSSYPGLRSYGMGVLSTESSYHPHVLLLYRKNVPISPVVDCCIRFILPLSCLSQRLNKLGYQSKGQGFKLQNHQASKV